MNPQAILELALNKEEISAIEALVLLQQGDYIYPYLFEVADTLSRRVNNNIVTYVKGKHIHYTNVCKASCKFCSFKRKRGAKDAFTLSVNEIIKAIRNANGIKEILLQGGLNPELNLNYHISLLMSIKEEFPNLRISGYSPSEIHFFAKRHRTTSMDVLRKLKEAGLDSLNGETTDFLNDRIRKKLCPDILRTNDWVEIIKTAHKLGISTTATLLFGHAGNEIYMSEHLEIIKHIQRETGGFRAFMPIPFITANTLIAKEKRLKPLQANEVLKVYAVCRLFYNKTLKNIQVDWAKLDAETVIKSLKAGVNEMGVINHDSYYIGIANNSDGYSLSNIKSLITKAGKIPIERQWNGLKHMQEQSVGEFTFTQAAF